MIGEICSGDVVLLVVLVVMLVVIVVHRYQCHMRVPRLGTATAVRRYQ
jgi:hypothetical protein